MHVYLLGSTENKENISGSFSPLLIFLIIVISLVLLHLHKVVDEVDCDEPEHSADELLDQYFDGDQKLSHRTTTHGGCVSRRRVSCAFCGNLSTTRCPRCKVARYCSVECQIRHWRSGHKDECYERETEEGQVRHIHDHGRTTAMLVEKSDKENIPNASHGEWSLDVGGRDAANNISACEECGNPSTTICPRCNVVRYCSVKCLIMNWKWHKPHCIAEDVNTASTEGPNGYNGEINNSYEEEEEEIIHSSAPLSLEFHPEGTENLKSPIEVSQDPTKEDQVHQNWVKYLEEELIKSRQEILSLQSECEEWKKRANFARESFQSMKKEFEHKLLVLKNEKESMSNAEKKAYNVIRGFQERLNHFQISVQENVAEKRKLEEHIRIVESECAKMKKALQEEQKRGQYLTLESNKSREFAKIAKREVEAVRQELQQNFLRDVTIAESRAVFAETQLSDLCRKIKLTDYKSCTICLTNEKDLAFGCGHMTCRDCGSKLSKCPICREQITCQIKLFPG